MDQELRLDWSQFTGKLLLLQDYTKKKPVSMLFIRENVSGES